MKRLKFVGKYSSLKHKGFMFSNHGGSITYFLAHYENDRIVYDELSIYKAGSCVVHGNNLVNVVLDKVLSFIENSKGIVPDQLFYDVVNDDIVKEKEVYDVYDDYAILWEHVLEHGKPPKRIYSPLHIGDGCKKALELIYQMYKDGDIELVDLKYPEEWRKNRDEVLLINPLRVC